MFNSAPGQLTRQELYDKIRETSKDEYILAEMKRLGFWESDDDKPEVPETIIKRRGELQRQLNDLLKQQRLYSDPEEALKALRKERMQAALQKRVETRKKKADERHERALTWHEKQQHTISWLGEAVSLGLTAPTADSNASHQGSTTSLSSDQAVSAHGANTQNEAVNNASGMKHQDLPTFDNHKALAESIGITLNELRFLSFQRSTSKVSHYQHFQIAKKTGGFREISAPMPRLKRAQYWVLDNILCHVPLHEAAHGFVAGRSILTNAKPHVGQAVVVNLDLQNFFPTISYRRIKGLFHKMGYDESIATVLALLCSEADTQKMELDGEQWFVQQGEQHLPQGAPTSPTISNIICRSLDVRLQGLAKKHGFNYSRYADDMTFSGDKTARESLRKLLWGVQAIVADEGFILHPDKTRIMNKGQQQEVTGIVVNDYPSIDRKTLRRFRALLHQVEQTGIQGKSWNGVSEPEHLLRSMLGFSNFVAMVLPEKGEAFKQQAKALYEKHSNKVGTKTIGQLRKAEFRKRAAAGQAPWESWKEAPVKIAPVREKTVDELQEERNQVLAERREAKKIEKEQQDRQRSRRGGFPGASRSDSRREDDRWNLPEDSSGDNGPNVIIRFLGFIGSLFTGKK
ncbi:reverse transcriptase family protein [Leucothrix arctica]|uniref:RNA-directed DNA polymerase n=1 Tax=Leucothrix arctica TaxID=1481894 RepID=A0A317CB28_9GAMM|nr:reverse transcriptase family protein [Leucothrix arctica]PWQ93570.1 RNA-dependent DNA polymerase [Leucothrix arctica]